MVNGVFNYTTALSAPSTPAHRSCDPGPYSLCSFVGRVSISNVAENGGVGEEVIGIVSTTRVDEVRNLMEFQECTGNYALEDSHMIANEERTYHRQSDMREFLRMDVGLMKNTNRDGYDYFVNEVGLVPRAVQKRKNDEDGPPQRKKSKELYEFSGICQLAELQQTERLCRNLV
ncbi:hypothetical protein B0H14DRAFT_2614980 [Mycena olivaceomarginata]|nr:hypothetical protein B0H14DRAFT_2614980 [Mycena olivaceomarginata]